MSSVHSIAAHGRVWTFLAVCLLWLTTAPAIIAAAAATGPGEKLPGLSLRASGLEKDAAYLGSPSSGIFDLEDVKAELVLIEIVGAYCPICHQQAPDMNRFHQRVRKNPRLAEKVRFLALAVGATDKEAEVLRGQFKHDFPILNDPDFKAHKLLGEPKTPYTMVVRVKSRDILWTHLGRIEDYEGLAVRLEEALR